MILVNYAIFTGAFSAFTDLFLAIYPSTVLLKLKMSLRKRLALCGALGLGCIATAMAIVKCVQLPGLNDKVDFTYSTCDLVLWTCVEANVVVIASTMDKTCQMLSVLWFLGPEAQNDNHDSNMTGPSRGVTVIFLGHI
ncbi:hypothetical protein VTN31DRAFT_1943 [Thermomyces dupontii]|uniref:uncharacterized protein n=1 Tax=Talaromyces thermophilus TaxID=28565 RepID=UPI003742536D